MPIELVVDNREHHLINEIGDECKVTIETLDIGDVLFRDGDDIILVIERKTVEDLRASICDGRAREQKARLLHSGIDVSRIMYLIEGNLDREISGTIPTTTLLGSVINTQLRDGIKVYKTASLRETSVFIQKLLDKLQKDGNKYFLQEGCMTAKKYASTLKKKKKENMTPTVWFISQLALIPQVTEKIAEKIIEKYPTLSSLVLEYERTPDHIRDKLLADLSYPIKNDKKRRVGEKLSLRIYQFFYGL
jgi:ERCC4-type nuclease